MFMDIRAFDFSLTKPIKDRIEARVGTALSGMWDGLQRVTVRLYDVNALRGGVDKRCRIVVAIRGRAVAVADAIDADLYLAIDEAARRLRRVVRRVAKQHVDRDRRHTQRLGTLVAA